MDELITYLVMIAVVLAIIAAVVMALISVGPFIMVAIAGVGVISGVVVAIKNFFGVLVEAHEKLPFTYSVYVMEFYERLYEKQPAKLMYPFGGGWQVMKYVKDNLFKRTQSAANFWYTQGAKFKAKAGYESKALLKYYYWSAYVGFQLSGFLQFVSAQITVSIFFAIQFLILVFWMSFSMALMGFLAGWNFLYGYYYKIYTRCNVCHSQMNIPVYVCPVCASEHTRLWPSVYGIFHHTCLKCGSDLPTLDRMGRKKLTRKCVACSNPMNTGIGGEINAHIPVIGGPNSGKSNFIFMATNQFIEKYAHPNGIEVAFRDEKDNQTYEENLKLLSSGNTLLKTPDIIPQAYNLSVKGPKERIGHIVYIYDAAGEAYVNEINTAQQQAYFQYIHGVILIIDPFSIDYFYRENENEINKIKNAIKPSNLNVMDAYARMVTELEASFGVKRGEKFKQPLAVVISKTDALDLEERIGRVAAQVQMAKDPSMKEADAINGLVEQFLVENQLGNFLRDLQLQFENVRFFSCSALGRLPDSSNHASYEPVGVLDPFLWLLGEVGVVNLVRERSKLMDQENKNVDNKNIFQKAKHYLWDSLIPRE
jgi:hypothetical protein